MKRSVVAGLTALVALAAAPSAAAATLTVRIERDGFRPQSLTVDVGDTVVWRNVDTVNHQVVADTGAFASPILRPGGTYSFTFRAAGTYRYRDALEPAERGVVVVRGPPPSVSLGLTAPVVVYGGAVHLQGRVSSGRAGQEVQVLAQPHGAASYVLVTVVRTTTNGFFDYPHVPSVLTSYQVRWRNVTSQPVAVQVRPRIRFRLARRGWFVTRVTAARSFAGRWVYLQRRSRFGQWVSVRKLTLGPRSGRYFRVPRRNGTYRIFMTVNQAGAGYLESWSGTQPVRRR